MKGLTLKATAGVAVASALVAGGVALGSDAGVDGRRVNDFRGRLVGYQEVPAVSTSARGAFRARLSPAANRIAWELTYRGLEGDVQQAHIHFGQPLVNGGVSVFLCSNLPNPPAGTQGCPAPPARITGTIDPSNVVGPGAQGIEPGSFAELVRAIRRRLTYANVHSSKFPGGEIRGQIYPRRDRRHR